MWEFNEITVHSPECMFIQLLAGVFVHMYKNVYNTHWDKTWMSTFFSFISTLCYISYPTDYFPPILTKSE